jgi:cholesterol transport system auxiliary component
MKAYQPGRTKRTTFGATARAALKTLALLLAMAALALGLAGCGKIKPINYYDINYPPITPTVQDPVDASLLVQRFAASDLYRANSIVYGSPGLEMKTYQNSLWAAPPTEMLRDALVRGLRSSGQFRAVMTFRSDSRGDFLVTGHLYEFKEVDASPIVARLSYDVELRDQKTARTIWKFSYNHDEPASENTVNAVAEAMSRNVQRSVQEVQGGIQLALSTNVAK